MASEFPCISCAVNITGRSHAIQCDECARWQHRKCNTGITHVQYRQLQKGQINLEWSCLECRTATTDTTDSAADITDYAADITDYSADRTHLLIPLALPTENDSMIHMEPSRIPDTSFNVEVDLQHPPRIEDEELLDPPPGTDVIPEGPVTYEVLAGGTRGGGRMLLSSDAFSYNVKRENKITGFIYWVCSVRTKTNRCPAWIKQYDTSHISSNIPHNHSADPTKAGKLKASVKVKNLAAASTFRPAGQIVKEALRELADVHQHIRAKPVNLLRTANRHRQANRPADPKPDELDFVINRDFLQSEDFI